MSNTPVRILNYIPCHSKRKWFNVVAFTKEPREHPRHSDEGQLIAKFRGLGDAFIFAQARLDYPGEFVLFVIR